MRSTKFFSAQALDKIECAVYADRANKKAQGWSLGFEKNLQRLSSDYLCGSPRRYHAQLEILSFMLNGLTVSNSPLFQMANCRPVPSMLS